MISLEKLYEQTKEFPRVSVALIRRKTKLTWFRSQDVLDELLELRFERGLIEDSRKIKYGRKNRVKYRKIVNTLTK